MLGWKSHRVVSHTHPQDHLAKMHLLNMAPGKNASARHGCSREEIRRSGPGHHGTHREDHTEPASQRMTSHHRSVGKEADGGLSIRLHLLSQCPLHGPHLEVMPLLTSSFSHFTKQEESEMLVLAKLFSSMFHKPVRGFLHLN